MRRLGVAGGLIILAVQAGNATAQQRVTLPGKDAPLGDRPTDVWSVGSAEGDTWELLSGVRAAAFDARDNLYALDAGNHRVLVFDANGEFVRSIGKQGGGPGEFQFPTGVALTADGRLVVAEGRGFSIFRTDGTFERLVTTNAGPGGIRQGVFGAHPDGGVITQGSRLPQPDETPAEGARMPTPILHYSLAEGASPDTILPLTEPMPTVRDMPGQNGRRMRMFTMGPTATFSRRRQWVPMPDGRVAVAEETDAWEVGLARDGDYDQVLTRPVRPRAPSERDRERAREERRASLAEGGGVRVSVGGGGTFVTSGGGGNLSEDQINQMIQEMTFAERIPVIQRLFADASGRLWIERAPQVWGDPAPVDLVASDGRYIGTITGVALPLATSPSGLGAWVEKDELGVEKLVVRRLPASWK